MKKIYLPCMQCQKEKGIPNFRFIEQEQNNDLVYRLICDKGHETVAVQQSPKFEIIFDMACTSLRYEDYAAAVKHCVTAIERFHEFYVQCVWFSSNRELENLEKSYGEYWKRVKQQSERQLGTFYSLFYNKYNDMRYDITDKMSSFRNNVVHKGYICTKKEAYDYLEKAFNYILDMLSLLHKDYEVGLQRAISYNLKHLQSKYGNISVFCDNHIVSTVCIYERISFEERMQGYYDSQNKMNSALSNINKLCDLMNGDVDIAQFLKDCLGK